MRSLIALAACLLSVAAPARAQSPAAAEETVAELYRLVTFEPGRTPDWDRVRSLFLPEAVVVLRASREELKVLSLDGFVEDFVAFIERAGAQRTGFDERLVRVKPTVYGDIAHVLAVYEASIPGSGQPAQQGLDSFELIRKDGRWRIAAVTNEVPPAGGTVAEDLGAGPWVARNEPPRTEVSFQAADGVTIYGDLHLATAPRSAPLVLLFHQAGGDARGEYGPVVERLLAEGYHVLAIDQRKGGDRFGSVNRTVARLPGAEYSYCDAYPDLEAALAFAIEQGFTGRKAAWGSSYSAALVIRLGAAHPGELDAVLAFSPASGDPMSGCRPERYAADIQVPVLALRPASEMQREATREQLSGFSKLGFRTYVAEPGVHGSSMLVPARVEGDTEPTWKVVLQFLHDNLLSPEVGGAARKER